MIHGIDVSTWQRKVDWRAVSAAGKSFAYVRVADGTAHLDGRLGEHMQGAADAGLLVGTYLFFRASRDPIEQARLIASQQHMPGMLPPVLDLEQSSDGGEPRELVWRHVVTCLEEIERLCGTAIVYTCASWWDTWMPRHVSTARRPLWVASYGVDSPMMPRGWEDWTIWQTSGTGRCPGVEGLCDLNVYRGSIDELRAFAGRVC